MLSWKDIVILGLGARFPPEVVILIFSVLKREHIVHLIEESRDYHIDRMPRVERLFYSDSDHYPFSEGSYLNIKVNDNSEEEANIYSLTLDEFTDKWLTINPKGKEYTYFDCWRWDRFSFPYMNFVYSFNRGRIFLRFLKGHEWYDLNSEDNIVDRLTDYKGLK